MNLSDILRPVRSFALTAGLAGVVGLAAPAAVSFAQDADGASAQTREGCHGRRGGGHHGRGRHMARMAEDLNLSDAQQAQIRTIMQEARQGERGPGTRGQVHERIQAVLTPAQRTRAQELRQEHTRERVERRVTHMTERLGLSATQAQQVGGILRNAAMQRRALSEQARGADDRAGARDAMRGLHERTDAQIRAVLNAEQAEQLDAMRARRGERGERGHHGRRGERGPRGARGGTPAN